MKAKLMGLVAVGSLMMGAAGVNAANLVTYSFTGVKASGGPNSGDPDAQPAFASASAVTVGSGVTEVVPSTSGANRGTDVFEAQAWNSSSTFDINQNEYFEFSYTPNTSGHSLSKLSFSTYRPLNSPNGPLATLLYYKVGVGGTLTSLTVTNPTSTDVNGPQSHESTFALNSLTATTPIFFRIYGSDSDSSTLSLWNIDDVVLEGTSEVPEPATIGLLGLAGVALLRRRA